MALAICYTIVFFSRSLATTETSGINSITQKLAANCKGNIIRDEWYLVETQILNGHWRGSIKIESRDQSVPEILVEQVTSRSIDDTVTVLNRSEKRLPNILADDCLGEVLSEWTKSPKGSKFRFKVNRYTGDDVVRVEQPVYEVEVRLVPAKPGGDASYLLSRTGKTLRVYPGA